MAGGISLNVKGLKELQAQLLMLSNLEEREVHALRFTFLEAAKAVQAQIALRAPVGKIDGGNLRRSIKVAISPSKRPAAFVAVDRKIAFYGRFVEYGTRYAAPHPFWRPGVQAGKGHAQRIMTTGLKEVIESAARKSSKGST